MSDKSRKDIHDDWKVDVNDYSFFDKLWQDWAPVYEVIPVDPQVMQDYLDDPTDEEPQPTTVEYDPLDKADNVVRNVITSFRAWGQGPILAAMKGLDINSVSDQDTADQVLDWLGENYDTIFDGDYDFSDVPKPEEYTYVATEMELTYEPQYSAEEKTIRRAYGGGHYPIDEGPGINLADYSDVADRNSLYELD